MTRAATKTRFVESEHSELKNLVYKYLQMRSRISPLSRPRSAISILFVHVPECPNQYKPAESDTLQNYDDASASPFPVSPSSSLIFLFSSFLSRLSWYSFTLSSSLSTGGLSPIADPHGARISLTTCRTCLVRGVHRENLTVSP